MALGIVETFALIIAVLAAIKIIVILVKPSSWMKVVKTVYMSPILTTIISLILAALVLNYLLAEVTIVQIFAVMLFAALLGAISVSAYSKEVISMASKMLKDKTIVKRAWLAILVWIALIIWVLYVLLA